MQLVKNNELVESNDMKKKHNIGLRNPRVVFTDHEIELMLELEADGMSQKQIAAKFGISKGHLSNILSGRRRGFLTSEKSV